jgi:hypothetical protein
MPRSRPRRSGRPCRRSPAVSRKPLELAYFGGHSYSEVAQLLRIPPGTAKTRIRGGLTRLRDTLSSGRTEQAQPADTGIHLGLVTSQIGKSTPCASGS